MSNKKDRPKLDLERDKLRQYIFDKLNKVEEEFKPEGEESPESLVENVQPASLEDELKAMREEINSLRQFIASTSNTAMAEVAQQKMDRYVDTIQKYTGVEMPLDEDIFGSDDIVTKAQLASNNNDLFARLQKSLASLGGGGIGKQEVEEMLEAHEFEADSNYVERSGDEMLGALTLRSDVIATQGVKFAQSSATGALTADPSTDDPTNITWYPNPLSVSLGSNDHIVVHHGVGPFTGWIAVSETDEVPQRTIARSLDGERWLETNLHDSWNVSFDNGRIYGVTNHYVESDNEWVIFGAAGQVAKSLDGGASWAPCNILSDSQQDSYASSVYALAYGNGKYVATTENAIWYSSDRMATWTKTSRFADVFDSANGNGETLVTYGGDRFLATGMVNQDSTQYAKVAQSVDGETWGLVTDFNNQVDDSYGQGQRIHDITYGAGKFILAHGDGALYHSANGISDWTTVQGTLLGNNGLFNNSEPVRAMGYGNGLWVFGGDRAHLAVALDSDLTATGPGGGATLVNTVMKRGDTEPTSALSSTGADIGSVEYGDGVWVLGMRDLLATGLWEDSNTPQHLYWRDEQVGLAKHDLLNSLATANLYSIVDVGRDSGLGKYISDAIKFGAAGFKNTDSLPEGLSNLYYTEDRVVDLVDSSYVTSRVTIDGAILFAGNYDLTADSAPATPLHGNMVVNSGTGVTVATWTGIVGDSVDPGDQAFWDSNASAWSLAGNTGEGLVRTSGDTMSGFLTLAGDPTANLHAATKQYVDNNQGQAYTGGTGISVVGTVVNTDDTVLRAYTTLTASNNTPTQINISGSNSSSVFKIRGTNSGTTDLFRVSDNADNGGLYIKANRKVYAYQPTAVGYGTGNSLGVMSSPSNDKLATVRYVKDQVAGADGGGGVELHGSSTPPASRDKGTLLLTTNGSLYIYI